MKIENEIVQFSEANVESKLKGLSRQESYYLNKLVRKQSLKSIILDDLNNAKMADFISLFELVKKITNQNFVKNENFLIFFKNTQNVSVNSKEVKNVGTRRVIESDFERLKVLPFLRSLNHEVVQSLLTDAEIADFQPQSYICKNGDIFSNHLYILISGEAAIYGLGEYANKFIGFIRPQSVFGETSFFLYKPRTADVVATKKSQVLIIKKNYEFLEKKFSKDQILDLINKFWIQRALLSSEIFKNIPLESLDDLVVDHQLMKVSTGQVLFLENEIADGAYIILQGQLSVKKAGQVIATLSQGQIVGEMALFQSSGKRTATVECAKEALLLPISIHKFQKLISENLFLGKIIQEVVQKRTTANNRK